MMDHVYKTIELTGTATTTPEKAVRNAIERASKTIQNMRWFQVAEVR
ncbi:MAG: dodecin domain-containing protein, partial [Candidatus Hydrogenedentes bacterium]|nr:dodecin domain-containing protein [Candidatus Hydrogenedentota bacterium]